jgi:hypothetical protein
VVRHYNDPRSFLENYSPAPQPTGFRDRLATDAGTQRARDRLAHLDHDLEDPLELTEEEQDLLVEFLEQALTDSRYGLAEPELE